MSTAKAGKLLAKALDNSSKDEATTAFSMAFSYAERAGIRLSTIHRVEVVETKGGSINPERERELVDKYNATLKRAKELAADLERAEQKAESYLNQAAKAKVEIIQLREQLEAGGVTEGMQEALELAQKMRDAYNRAKEERDTAQARVDELMEQVAEVLALAQEATDRFDEADDARETAEAESRILREQLNEYMYGDPQELEKAREELKATTARRDQLAKENAQQRDRLLQLEKDKAELQRQVDINKAAREGMYERNVAQSGELAAALAECLTLRATVSEQAEEIDFLRSDRDTLRIELSKHEINPLKKLLGW